MAVPGLRVLDDWIDLDEERRLLAIIDGAPWDTSLRRRVQQYGAPYVYRGRRAPSRDSVAALPDWIQPLALRLVSEGIFARMPEQVIVNEYLPGQGIAAHVDHPAFGPTIASLSLASPVVMDFVASEVAHLVLRARSLLVLTGRARAEVAHRIAPRRSDPIDGRRVARVRRVSLTFRTLV